MKKIICMILILSFIFSFTACGKKNDVNNKETNTPTTSEVTEGTEGESKETTESTEPTTGTIAPDGTTVSTDGKNETADGSNGTTPPKSETTPSTGTTPPSTTNPPTTNPPATNPPTTPPTVKTCDHSNTEVRNKKDATTSSEGYTGDTYCKDCGKLISSGSSIPKIKQTVSVSHDYYDIEMKIFNEINAERTRAGLNALIWDEGLYAGAKIRSKEYYEYRMLGIGTGPHTRADGSLFITAITENSSYSEGSFDGWAENCAGDRNGNTFVSDWMESSGHKENILRQNMKYIAIGVCYEDNMYFASTIFVG